MFEKSPRLEIKKESDEIVIEEIAELERPMEVLIDKIGDRIETGEYGLVLGIDASGRVPALIIGEFIKDVYEKKGNEGPRILFLAGAGSIDDPIKPSLRKFKKKKIDEWVKHNGLDEKFNRRVLIVDDTMIDGTSVKPIVEILRKMNIKVDIAVVGAQVGPGISKALDADVFEGEYYVHKGMYSRKNFVPSIWGRKDISGVTKDKNKLFSEPTKTSDKELEEIKKNWKFFSREYDWDAFTEDQEKRMFRDWNRWTSTEDKIQKTINLARHDIHILVERLRKQYESQKQENEK